MTKQIAINAELELVIMLDQLYIDARYPGEIGLLPYGKPSLSIASKPQKPSPRYFHSNSDTHRLQRNSLKAGQIQNTKNKGKQLKAFESDLWRLKTDKRQ